MAPSPVTLQAVPKLSMAIYRAIMSPSSASPKPSMLCKMPSAAIIAPPGTPGAATMVTPSMQINPANWAKGMGVALINKMASAHATIFIVLPDR